MENQKKNGLPAFAILGIIALIAAIVLAGVNMITAPVIEANEKAAQRAAFEAIMPADDYETVSLPDGYDGVTTLVKAVSGGSPVGYCVTAAKAGYGGPVDVTLGVDANGIVTGAKIGTSTEFAETAGLGNDWKKPEYCERLVGLDAVNGGSFDAKTGATVTSNAVKDAVDVGLHAVAEVAMGKTVAADPLITFGSGSGSTATAAGGAASYPENGVITGTAPGFGGDVTVTLTLENSLISAVEIDASSETDGLGKLAEEDAFKSTLIGKQLPLSLGSGIDAIAGATVTSNAVLTALNEGEVNGTAVTGTAAGFGGDVTVTAELDADGVITAMKVEAPNETEGLGKKAEEEAFTSQFVGKTLPVSLGSHAIDAIAGATVTSTAVVQAANSATEPVAYDLTKVAGQTLDASGQGFGGEVTANVSFDENGAITALTVSAPDETEGLGKLAEGEAFTGQFIGKTIPVALGTDVDALAGATITSTAVVDMINGLAMDKAAQPAEEEAPAEEAAPAEDAAAAGALTASKQGFQSEVKVTAELDGNTIKSLTVDSNGETAGLGQNAMTEAFTSQFIGKSLPISMEDVEAITGATITTTAVVDALNSLAAPAEEAAPAEDAAAAGALTASKQGFQSEVKVTAELDGNTIKSLTIDSNGETAGLGQNAMNEAFTSQFIGKSLPISMEDVEAITGATITTTAVVDALNSLAAPAEETPAEPVAEEAAAGAVTASKQGFQSEVKVTAELDGNTIKSLTIDSNGETAGLGQNAMNEAFTSQFIGKTLPIDPETVDGVAGATLTTTAVVNALNSLEAAPAEAAPAAEEAPAEEAIATDAAAAQTAKAFGFASDVVVTAEVEGNTIKSLTVDANGETAGLGQNAMAEAFTSQFIGKTLPIDPETVDGVAGATLTTTAVVDALNSLAAAPAEKATATDAAAAAMTGKAFGFASDVVVTAEVEGNTIKSLTVDANGETAGLGQNAMNEAFTAQFIGKTLPIDPETVDGVAGATLTTTAVVNALNSLEAAPAEAAPAAEEAPAEEATATDAAAAAMTGKAFGFASDVVVTAEVEGNTIKSLTVDANGETAGLGQNAMNEAFTAQFIGKTLPIDPETVDGVAGATLTTTAVVNALNSLEAAPAEAAPAAEETPTEEATATDAAAAQTAKAFGFASDVAVTVELDGNTIKSLTVDANGETAGLGQNAMAEAFTSQFIGKTLPIDPETVDGVAGATLTTTAVVNALNSLEAAPAEAVPAAEEAPAEEATATDAAAAAQTAKAFGFMSDVVVTAEVDGNTIKSLTVDANGETAGLGQNAMAEAFTSQFIGKTLPIDPETVDGVAGATLTTTAVVNALNSLEAAPAEAAPAAEEAPAEEAIATDAAAAQTAKAFGFASDVAVTAEVEGNTIKSLTVDANGETAGLGQNAMNEAFTSQFIGKTLPIAIEDIDAIAGATLTTTAVVNALNSLAE